VNNDKFATTLIREHKHKEMSTTKMLPKTTPDFLGSRQYTSASTATAKTHREVRTASGQVPKGQRGTNKGAGRLGQATRGRNKAKQNGAGDATQVTAGSGRLCLR